MVTPTPEHPQRSNVAGFLVPLLILFFFLLAVWGLQKRQEAKDADLIQFELYHRYQDWLVYDINADSLCSLEMEKKGGWEKNQPTGPACQYACESRAALIRFDEAHQDFMKRNHFAPDEQHLWCKEPKP